MTTAVARCLLDSLSQAKVLAHNPPDLTLQILSLSKGSRRFRLFQSEANHDPPALRNQLMPTHDDRSIHTCLSTKGTKQALGDLHFLLNLSDSGQ